MNGDQLPVDGLLLLADVVSEGGYLTVLGTPLSVSAAIIVVVVTAAVEGDRVGL